MLLVVWTVVKQPNKHFYFIALTVPPRLLSAAFHKRPCVNVEGRTTAACYIQLTCGQRHGRRHFQALSPRLLALVAGVGVPPEGQLAHSDCLRHQGRVLAGPTDRSFITLALLPPDFLLERPKHLKKSLSERILCKNRLVMTSMDK